MIPRSRRNLFSFGGILFLGRDEKGIGRNRLVEVSLHDETKVQSDTVCDTVLRLDLWSLEGVLSLRPGRRLPVQGLSEGSLSYRDRLPS